MIVIPRNGKVSILFLTSETVHSNASHFGEFHSISLLYNYCGIYNYKKISWRVPLTGSESNACIFQQFVHISLKMTSA